MILRIGRWARPWPRGADVLRRFVCVGEKAAQARLAEFIDHKVGSYKQDRDFPGVEATSRLSENLTYGEISPRMIYHAGRAALKCLTISKEQHDFAKKRMFKAGLADRVDIVMQDYRDERGGYDGIASIEMFEAVGKKYWPSYFKTVHDCLLPGKQATIQVITVADHLFDNYCKSVDFIQKHIFPGGMLPSPSVLRTQIEKAGLGYRNSIEFGKSYSLTLRRWYETFNNKWDDISDTSFDQRFNNMWNFYLTSCASGFEYGTTDVTQVTMRRN